MGTMASVHCSGIPPFLLCTAVATLPMVSTIFPLCQFPTQKIGSTALGGGLGEGLGSLLEVGQNSPVVTNQQNNVGLQRAADLGGGLLHDPIDELAIALVRLQLFKRKVLLALDVLRGLAQIFLNPVCEGAPHLIHATVEVDLLLVVDPHQLARLRDLGDSLEVLLQRVLPGEGPKLQEVVIDLPGLARREDALKRAVLRADSHLLPHPSVRRLGLPQDLHPQHVGVLPGPPEVPQPLERGDDGAALGSLLGGFLSSLSLYLLLSRGALRGLLLGHLLLRGGRGGGLRGRRLRLGRLGGGLLLVVVLLFVGGCRGMRAQGREGHQDILDNSLGGVRLLQLNGQGEV
eukprot:RCo015506